MENVLPENYDLDVPIRTFMTKRLIGIESEETVKEAAQRMVEFNISSLVVMENDEIIGFMTDGDIKKKLVAKGLSPEIPVKKIMVTELITTDIDDTVKEVLGVMTEKNIKHMLVKEQDEIVGILTFSDLIDVEKQRLETYIARE